MGRFHSLIFSLSWQFPNLGIDKPVVDLSLWGDLKIAFILVKYVLDHCWENQVFRRNIISIKPALVKRFVPSFLRFIV